MVSGVGERLLTVLILGAIGALIWAKAKGKKNKLLNVSSDFEKQNFLGDYNENSQSDRKWW